MKIKFLTIIPFFITTVSFSQVKKWSLKECVSYALENNLTIQQSSLDQKFSELDKKNAFGNFLPNLNLSTNHSWNIGLTQNITTGVLENQTVSNTSAGISSNVDLFKGLQNRNTFKRASLAILASQYQLDQLKEDISLNIVDAFLQILFAKENLKVLEQQLVSDEENLVRSEALVEAGTIPKGDLLDVKSSLATDYQQIVASRNTLLLAKISLAQILQLDDFSNFDIEEINLEIPLSKVLSENPEDVYKLAKNNRLDIKLSETNVSMSEFDVKISEATRLPSLIGFYNFNTRASYNEIIKGFNLDEENPLSEIGATESGELVYQPNFNPILGPNNDVLQQFKDNKGHSFGLSLQVPIFNKFQIENSIERSKVTLAKSRLSLDQNLQTLKQTVYRIYTDALGAQKTFEASKLSFDAQQNAFNYAEERFKVGLLNAFDYNQTKLRLVNAKSDLIRSKFDYIFKLKILEYYSGIPIETNL